MIKWLSNGQRIFLHFCCHGDGIWGPAKEWKLNIRNKIESNYFCYKRTLPTIHFCPMKLFLCKGKQTLMGKKRRKRKLLSSSFYWRIFNFFLRYHIGTVLMISFYLIRFLHPFSFGVWKGIFFRTHRLLCCTGKNQYEGPGLNFLQNANQSLLSWKRRSREKVRREAL